MAADRRIVIALRIQSTRMCASAQPICWSPKKMNDQEKFTTSWLMNSARAPR